MSKVYGYVRVSSADQNEYRQMIVMKQVGVPEENIFMDKQSGKDFDRPDIKCQDPMYKKYYIKMYN